MWGCQNWALRPRNEFCKARIFRPEIVSTNYESLIHSFRSNLLRRTLISLQHKNLTATRMQIMLYNVCTMHYYYVSQISKIMWTVNIRLGHKCWTNHQKREKESWTVRKPRAQMTLCQAVKMLKPGFTYLWQKETDKLSVTKWQVISDKMTCNQWQNDPQSDTKWQIGEKWQALNPIVTTSHKSINAITKLKHVRSWPR